MSVNSQPGGTIPVTVNIPVPQTVNTKPKAPAQPQASVAAPAAPQQQGVQGVPPLPPPTPTAIIMPWTPESEDDSLDMSMLGQMPGVTPGTRSGVPTGTRTGAINLKNKTRVARGKPLARKFARKIGGIVQQGHPDGEIQWHKDADNIEKLGYRYGARGKERVVLRPGRYLNESPRKWRWFRDMTDGRAGEEIDKSTPPSENYLNFHTNEVSNPEFLDHLHDGTTPEKADWRPDTTIPEDFYAMSRKGSVNLSRTRRVVIDE